MQRAGVPYGNACSQRFNVSKKKSCRQLFLSYKKRKARAGYGSGTTATANPAGYQVTCAVLNDNSVKCWGHNLLGELGIGDAVHRGDGPNEMGDNLPAVPLP